MEPPAGPQAMGAIVSGTGAYTNIVAIYGPAEAAYGEIVSLQVVVKNLTGYTIYISVTGSCDGISLTLSPDYVNVGTGATYTFTTTFTMPNKGITLDAWSFYWAGTEWYQDDHKAVSITLVKSEFSSLAISDYSKQ